MPALPQQSSCSRGSASSTPGIAVERGAWLRLDPLGVFQMARVLERDTERERLSRRRHRRVGEELGNVDDIRADVILQM